MVIKVREFKELQAAQEHAVESATKYKATRYVGLYRGKIYCVGTYKQLNEEMGLDPIWNTSDADPSSPRRQMTPPEKEQIWELYQSGTPVHVIVRKMSRSDSTVRNLINARRNQK